MKKLIAKWVSIILSACAMLFAVTLKPVFFSPKVPKELMDKNKD
ncbi:hypothetical protein SAMN04487970_100287 [Paenibacillus tianmuensis]|uniref:Cyclic lactone autoinducer peptide n=1 Tax=Paenibacillus tianmuensis TaxID=624147 RepID=A0A1G4PE69_9BACL|nr:hypothetical protein SAMN04487970_100287 [Paenibacillus tianmuensis]